MFRYLFIGILGFTPCCGPGTALQPLIGESTEIHELLETPPSVLEERAPLHAAEQVLASLRSQNNEALWSHLSLKSQAALEARFSEAHQNSRGATLIRAMYDSPMLEKEGTSLEALFFGTQVQSFQTDSLRKTMRDRSSMARDDRVQIIAISTASTKHATPFLLEERSWKLDRIKF